MLVFNPNLIEVRHVESGHVIRIIPGNEIRCIWDGLSNANSSLNTAESNVAVGEPWFHAVMGGAKSPSGDWEAVSQRLFALTPTLPFYLPSISQPAAGLETVSESLSEVRRPKFYFSPSCLLTVLPASTIRGSRSKRHDAMEGFQSLFGIDLRCKLRILRQ